MFLNQQDMPKVLAHYCKNTDSCPMKAVSRRCPFLLKNCTEATELAWKIHLGLAPRFDDKKFGFDLCDVEEVGYEYYRGCRCILIEREQYNRYFFTFYDNRRVGQDWFEGYYVKLTNSEVKRLSNEDYLVLDAALRRFE